MCTIGNKTFVSLLQEHFISKGLIPMYELVHSKEGTHNPEFTIRVKIGEKWVEGSGKSKQQAKQKAAEQMLLYLKIIDDSTNNDVSWEFTEEDVKQNYVGSLNDYCFTHQYPVAKYDLEEAAGPPHSRIFKIVCSVSNLQEFGISKTKKLAKQQAALKMLERLKKIAINNVKKIHEPKFLTIPENKLTDDEIISKYNSLKSSTTNYDQPAAYYKDHHKAYLELLDQSPKLNELLKTKKFDESNSLEILNEISSELEVNLSIGKIPTKDDVSEFTVIFMSVIPAIASIGRNEQNAAFNFLNSLLILCEK